jgi:ABC-type multidrug transport system ATPase subunit
MQIQLAAAGKRFRMDWIFRGMDYTFQDGHRHAVLGPNGSGKSTLLKVLSGFLSLSKGQIHFHAGNERLDPDLIYRHISYAAPYIELIEEFTLEEALELHTRLKPFRAGLTPEHVYELLKLPRSRHKEIRYFSSGMKQRVKLALAICSDTPVLLLDEPTTNLDLQAIEWYKNLVEEHAEGRLIVIASNDPADLELCDRQLQIMDYKSSGPTTTG